MPEFNSIESCEYPCSFYSHINTCSVSARPLLKTSAAIVSWQSPDVMKVNRGATLQTLK